MKPGETDTDKRTISFDLYASNGTPASGEAGEGAVATFTTTQLQVSYNYGTSYTTATGTFAHGGDGNYKYMFALTEVQASVGEKNVWLRYKAAGFRTRVIEVPLRYVDAEVTAIKAKTDNLPADPASQAAVLAAIPSTTAIRNAVLNDLLSNHTTAGTVGDAIAIAASMLQGNYYVDLTDNSSPNGQTSARIRLFYTAAAMASVTPGGTSEGEFATFQVTTAYSGPGKITTHQVIRI